MLKSCLTLFLMLVASNVTARASECLAVAEGLARVQSASFQVTAVQAEDVRITFVGHSTYRIETPEGIVAATDYSGFAGDGPVPDLVTMNRAHSSHWTANPDPAIKHIFKGWGENNAPAKHDTAVGDMRVRNVTTDIRNNLDTRITDGNSIFIFEVANLCIGHLGHLHHELTPGHIGWIGKLDVVMVPVDGGLTLPHQNMMGVLKDIKATIVLPMHVRRAGSLEEFLAAARQDFKIEYLKEPTLTVNWKTLPTVPTVMVMPGY